MAFLDIKNVEIKGLSACVPKTTDKISDIYKWDGVDNFIEATGVEKRRRASEGTTTADLCFHAADRLINELDWSREDVDAIIFVTQTPDYIFPATSCVLQHRLGLPDRCFALDISLGCSGWVYSLSVLSSLLQSGTIKKGLLLAGETPLKITSTYDRACFPLFGEAGTATALEHIQDARGFKFLANTDGSGFETIIVREGGFRHPINEDNIKEHEYRDRVVRRAGQQELDGMNVFSFGITKAPKAIKQLSEHFKIDTEKIDIFTFHQANLMMNEMIRKKLKLPKDKVPYCIDEFGNTSSASIPLALVTRERHRLQNETLQHIACGFGVGLSWATAWFETNKIVVPNLIEV